MPGNDDGGAMGSWAVWAMMGLRPVVSGTQRVALTGPLFDSVTLVLAKGKSLHVRAVRKSPSETVLERITLNGVLLTGNEVLWSELAKGVNLECDYWST